MFANAETGFTEFKGGGVPLNLKKNLRLNSEERPINGYHFWPTCFQRTIPFNSNRNNPMLLMLQSF
jgi:hypothetical protein